MMMPVSKQYVPMPRDLLDSPPFQILNIHERRCLDRLLLEHCQHGGKDNGRLPVTHRNLIEHGVHPRHVTASLRVLEALGIVVCTERGRGANAEFRRPSLWRITFLTTRGPEKDAKGRSTWINSTHEWTAIGTVEEANALAALHRVREKRRNRPPPRRKPARAPPSHPR